MFPFLCQGEDDLESVLFSECYFTNGFSCVGRVWPDNYFGKSRMFFSDFFSMALRISYRDKAIVCRKLFRILLRSEDGEYLPLSKDRISPRCIENIPSGLYRQKMQRILGFEGNIFPGCADERAVFGNDIMMHVPGQLPGLNYFLLGRNGFCSPIVGWEHISPKQEKIHNSGHKENKPYRGDGKDTERFQVPLYHEIIEENKRR